MPIGLTLPLGPTIASQGAIASSASEIEATYYNLRSLLLTNWGDRVTHFYLGCNLQEFLFEPNDQQTLQMLIENRVTEQVNTWLPFVGISSVSVVSNSDSNVLTVKVDYLLTGRQSTGSVTVSVSSNGG